MNVARENAIEFATVPEAVAVRPTDKRSFRFVLFVWLAMSVAALALVAIYGSNVPSWDDWDIVPAATGPSACHSAMAMVAA